MLRRCTLRFRTGPLAGRTYSLGPGEYLFIGSGPSCAIRIEDDPTVATVHACVYFDENSGRIRLKDMGSEHGTLRNGTRLTGSTVIRAGDRVSIGRLSTFHSSWWNALQASRMTRFSALMTRRFSRPPTASLPMQRRGIFIALAVLIAVAAGAGVYRIATSGDGDQALAARTAPTVDGGKRKHRKPRGDGTRGRASALPAERRFIWDEIVSISRRFGDPPPSAMDLGFVKEVERNIREFTLRGRHRSVLERKERYWGMITRILQEKGLPQDLGYIVWVESAFQLDVVSPVGAAGLWQFMPETAREYGLVVREGRDDRFDPRKATVAAAAYITDILRMFDSKRYLLALASYNTGQYRVLRMQLAATVTGAKRADFWQIRDSLPQETAHYVPRIMAAMIIGRNLERWPVSGQGNVSH